MIQIDTQMPDNCDECRFNTEYGFCKAMPDNFCGNTDDRKRPEWCPMKEQENCENCAIAIEDRQPIVRCKDCKHGHICINGRLEPMIKCELMLDEWLHEPEWFCADGER